MKYRQQRQLWFLSPLLISPYPTIFFSGALGTYFGENAGVTGDKKVSIFKLSTEVINKSAIRYLALLLLRPHIQ